MKFWRRNPFFISLNTRTLEIIKYYTILNQILYSRHWRILLMTERVECQRQCLTLFSCALQRMFLVIFVICSLKLLKILKEGLLKEDIDSCNRKIPILEDMNRRRSKKAKEVWVKDLSIILRSKLMEKMEMKNLKTSILMRNQKTLRVKRKTWKCTWISLIKGLTILLMHWKKLTRWWLKWVIKKLLLIKLTTKSMLKIQERLMLELAKEKIIDLLQKFSRNKLIIKIRVEVIDAYF